MDLDKLSLLYLRNVVADRIENMERRVDKYNRFGGDNFELFQEKVATAEAELFVMQNLKDKINLEIALQVVM